MSRLFGFRAPGTSSKSSANWLVVFSSQDTLPFADLGDLLSEDIGRNLQPDALLLLVRENVATAISVALKALAPEEWRVPIGATSVCVVGFDEAGGLGNLHHVSGPAIAVDAAWFGSLKTHGLRELFERRDGLIRPTATTHFVHPSGKHSEAFIRTANLLMLGPEVMFVAMTVLSFLKPDLEYVCVDTSSIASVAHAAVQLRGMFGPYRPPTINSFSSWKGIEGAYSFSLPRKTLALISASTSGNMARELVSGIGLPRDRVLVLFGLIKDPTDVLVLCNLAEDPRHAGSVALVGAEYRQVDCPMCREGSTPVHFVGDQFLADAIRHTSVTIVGTDITTKSKAFFNRYRCLGALGMRQLSNNGVAVDSFFVDVGKLKGSEFDQRLRDACIRHVPASTSLIVHAEDPSSAALAARIADEFAPASAAKPISASGIAALEDDSIDGGVVIVAGCIGSGGCLQSISRDLRDPAADAPRTYLVGVAKHPQHARHAGLRGDLIYSSTDHKHALVVIEEVTLPERQGLSAWEAEIGLLTALMEGSIPVQARDAITVRIAAVNGLGTSVDDFFWTTPQGERLALRKTFAFWGGEYDAEKASQGDVLLTIASVLENLRGHASARLHSTAFSHGFIAPTTFGRYNDGVIQSAFLRAALPSELDYSDDVDASREMSRILKRILDEADGPRGEASIEFLVSIACRRMKLKPGDLSVALAALDDADPLLVVLRDRCKAVAQD